MYLLNLRSACGYLVMTFYSGLGVATSEWSETFCKFEIQAAISFSATSCSVAARRLSASVARTAAGTTAKHARRARTCCLQGTWGVFSLWTRSQVQHCGKPVVIAYFHSQYQTRRVHVPGRAVEQYFERRKRSYFASARQRQVSSLQRSPDPRAPVDQGGRLINTRRVSSAFCRSVHVAEHAPRFLCSRTRIPSYALLTDGLWYASFHTASPFSTWFVNSRLDTIRCSCGRLRTKVGLQRQQPRYSGTPHYLHCRCCWCRCLSDGCNRSRCFSALATLMPGITSCRNWQTFVCRRRARRRLLAVDVDLLRRIWRLVMAVPLSLKSQRPPHRSKAAQLQQDWWPVAAAPRRQLSGSAWKAFKERDGYMASF